MFTPNRKRGGESLGLPDLSTIKQYRQLNDEVARDIRGGIEGVGRVARSLWNRAKRGRKTRQRTKRRKMTPAPTVSMSNGSGQQQTMGKRQKISRGPRPLKKRIAALEKKVQANYTTHVFKQEATLQATSLQNRCGYAEGAFLNPTIIETCIDAIPYVNPALPGTPSTFDTTTLTQPTKWKINCHSKVIMRNNYLYPCNVRCYVLAPKIDQNTTPQAAVTGGITEQASGPGVYSSTAPFTYPTDSKEFVDTFKVLNTCDMRLQSGDECVVPYNEDIQYDQEYRDNNADTYLKKFSRLFFIRIVGVVAHDSTTTTNIGIAPTALDCVVVRKLSLKFPSLAPLKTLEVVSGLTSMTTPVVGIASAETETAL